MSPFVFKAASWRAGLSALAIMTVAVGCASNDDQALCPAYDEYLTVFDEIAAANPTGATAADVVDAAELVLDELAQLRSVADGRYSAQIDQLDEAVDNLRRTLASLPDDGGYATWEPLVNDTIIEIENADDRLRSAIDPVCVDRTNDTAISPTTQETEG
jgi:hypothetical protein